MNKLKGFNKKQLKTLSDLVRYDYTSSNGNVVSDMLYRQKGLLILNKLVESIGLFDDVVEITPIDRHFEVEFEIYDQMNNKYTINVSHRSDTESPNYITVYKNEEEYIREMVSFKEIDQFFEKLEANKEQKSVGR